MYLMGRVSDRITPEVLSEKGGEYVCDIPYVPISCVPRVGGPGKVRFMGLLT